MGWRDIPPGCHMRDAASLVSRSFPDLGNSGRWSQRGFTCSVDSSAKWGAMEARTLLQVLVRERGWTFGVFRAAYEKAAQEVAAMLGESASTASLEEQTFRRWTSGRIRSLPNQPAPQVLEYMFGYPARQLLDPPTVVALTGPDVCAFNESDLAMTARDAAAHAGDAASLSVPDMTLDQLDDDVMALAREYSRTSPADVYRRAKELLHIAQSLLERTQVPRQRTRAYLAAGQSAALLAAIAFDLGSLSTSVSLSRTAALYGRVIEHGPLQAYAHGALAFLAYWGGRPAEAIRCVQMAQQFGGLGDTARARLSVIEGRAHGHLGNSEAAVGAVRRSLEQRSGARDELHDDIGGEFGFSDERVEMSNATTYLLLRDAAGAGAAAHRALRLLNRKPAGQRPLLVSTQAWVDLARARLLEGELDAVLEALRPVFEVPPEWRSTGTLERLAAVRSGLCRTEFVGAAEARVLGERIEEFSGAAAAHRVGGAEGPLVLEG